ncbi:MAG: hypothetical protein ACTSRG_07785 [Candidatus Helarchaeota archaeon]
MNKSVREGHLRWFWTVIVFLLISWASFYPTIVLGYLYFSLIPIKMTDLNYILTTIIFLTGNYFLILFLALGFTVLVIKAINAKWPPKIGTFENSIKNPDVYAWRIKNNLRSFARWLWEMPHLSPLRVFYLRRMGLKIGKKVRLGKYILEDDFIEIGDGTFMGKNSIISGHLIDHIKFTSYKTRIGKGCIFSNWSGAVGADIGDNSIILGSLYRSSAAIKGSECPGNGIHRGVPLKKIGQYQDLKLKQIKNLKQMIENQEKINYYESTISLIKTEGLVFKLKLIFGKVFITSGAVLFQFLIIYLYFFLISELGFPTGDLMLDSIFLAFVPPVIIVSIGFFMAGAAAITRLLMVFHFRSLRNIKDGSEFDLDDKNLKSWKCIYLWKHFSLFISSATPLAVGATLIFQSYLCQINKNVHMIKALVDPEFLIIDKNTDIAAFATVRTHYIKDNKLYFKTTEIGENVIIGSLAFVGAGTKIKKNTIIGIGAYIPENTICEPNSLYIGNPARRFPLSAIKYNNEN